MSPRDTRLLFRCFHLLFRVLKHAAGQPIANDAVLLRDYYDLDRVLSSRVAEKLEGE